MFVWDELLILCPLKNKVLVVEKKALLPVALIHVVYHLEDHRKFEAFYFWFILQSDERLKSN